MAVGMYGFDSSTQNQVLEFCNHYERIKEMGYPPQTIAGALFMNKNNVQVIHSRAATAPCQQPQPLLPPLPGCDDVPGALILCPPLSLWPSIALKPPHCPPPSRTIFHPPPWPHPFHHSPSPTTPRQALHSPPPCSPSCSFRQP